MAARAREIERLCNALHNVNDNVSYTRQQVKANSKRLAALEQSQAAQQHQLKALETLNESPNRLLFYRTLLILIESVWVSVKAASGGFTQAGGDAGKSSTVANCAKAVKVLGAVLSLAPMGGIVKAAANAGASAMSSANDARQAQICAHLNRLVTLDEGKFIAHTVAWQLCEAFAEQLEMLPKPPSVDRRKDSAGFMPYFKRVCGALGGAIADYHGI